MITRRPITFRDCLGHEETNRRVLKLAKQLLLSVHRSMENNPYGVTADYIWNFANEELRSNFIEQAIDTLTVLHDNGWVDYDPNEVHRP